MRITLIVHSMQRCVCRRRCASMRTSGDVTE
jgi:hypothetical protein